MFLVTCSQKAMDEKEILCRKAWIANLCLFDLLVCMYLNDDL